MVLIGRMCSGKSEDGKENGGIYIFKAAFRKAYVLKAVFLVNVQSTITAAHWLLSYIYNGLPHLPPSSHPTQD